MWGLLIIACSDIGLYGVKDYKPKIVVLEEPKLYHDLWKITWTGGMEGSAVDELEYFKHRMHSGQAFPSIAERKSWDTKIDAVMY